MWELQYKTTFSDWLTDSRKCKSLKKRQLQLETSHSGHSHSPTVLAATNFIEGGNFTSSDNSGGLASSGLVGWLWSEQSVKIYDSYWLQTAASAEMWNCKTVPHIVLLQLQPQSLSDGKAMSRGQRLSHRCPSSLVPFPACESYWASSE